MMVDAAGIKRPLLCGEAGDSAATNFRPLCPWLLLVYRT